MLNPLRSVAHEMQLLEETVLLRVIEIEVLFIAIQSFSRIEDTPVRYKAIRTIIGSR